MTSKTEKSSPVQTIDEAEGRRNPRRGGSSKVPNGDISMDILEDSTSSNDDDNNDFDDSGKMSIRTKKAPDRKRSISEHAKEKAEGRRSSRSTKFTSSMKDPRDDAEDLFKGVVHPAKKNSLKKARKSFTEGFDCDERHNPSKVKATAVRHSTQRRRVETAVHLSADEDESEVDESEDDDDDERLKIQRIIACKSLKRKDWKKICDKMNTSEVDFGSRWYQENDNDNDPLNDDAVEERFLVKWAELSYLHCSWETESDLIEQIDIAKNYLTMFFRKSWNGFLFSADERCDGDFFDPGYAQVDRILEIHLPENYNEMAKSDHSKFGIIMDRNHQDFEGGTGRQFLIKWTNLAYSESTFEFERDLILSEIEYEEQVKSFVSRSKKAIKSDLKQFFRLGEEEKRRTYKLFGDNSKMDENEREQMVSSFQNILADEIYPNGGQLRDYQAEGVSWMLSNLINRRSSILADEMGLGKTLQTCSFVNLVANRLLKRGPILVIAPLSTLQHWYREFTSWTGLNTIVYHGSAKDRELIREHEFAFECDRPKSGVAFNSSYLKKCMPRGKSKLERQWMVQVVITTPEILVADDFSELTSVEWEVLVVDEAHRLKNHQSKFAVNLRDDRFQFNHSLLLTGTPIQNDMKELWTLLNFIDPENFYAVDDFLEKFGDIKSKERIDELHESIRPYILRRLKEDVEKSVPPKEETLIEVELTVLQKQYYRALYEKNVKFLHRNKKKALDGPSISNLAMQLRKCCNHPFLLRGVEDDIRDQEAKSKNIISEGDFLVKFSGKLVLLDKLLPRLKETGHRVLIFSQFKIMLDIIEDYLSERKMKAERIDGSITGKKRQLAIDRFQAKDIDSKEAPFIMMLSTRAGGVGINLTAADTCIIFDSDWNPQNDLQAQARCHRIGQTKSVKVYRLLTRKTYEMQMFHMSSMKMGLDQAVLGGFESRDKSGEGAMTKEEVERLLRHGAYDIFNEDKAGASESESNAFAQQDIDSILERRSKTVTHDKTGSQGNVAGSTFSKASFKAPKTLDGNKLFVEEDVDIDDPDFWKKMIGDVQVENDGMALGEQKRKRREANYSDEKYQEQLENSLMLSDPESDSSLLDENDDSVDSLDNAALDNSHERREGHRERILWGKKPKISDPSQWDKSDVEKLLKGLQLYGYECIPWTDFFEKLSIANCNVDEARRLCWSLLLLTIREAANDEVVNARKRAVRAEEKKREEEGKKEDGDSGILGKTEVLQYVAGRVDIESCFQKLWEMHRPWMSRILEDAVAYARSHPPRPKESLLSAIRSASARFNIGQKKEINAVFAQSFWPALKNRGWKTELLESEKGLTMRYVIGDKSYKSVNAVLRAVPAIHPELAVMVNSIQKSLAANPPNTVVLGDDFFAQLNYTKLTAGSLSTLLDFYAPLQLLVDRISPKKLVLSKKCLSHCGYMKVAHDFVGPLVNNACVKDTINRLSEIVFIDKRVTLPHPQWSAKHDAVLIYAVAKHGWIEHDVCIRAITEDSSIKWGFPFEGTKDNAPAEGRIKATEEAMNTLVYVASRAASFFNHENEIIESLKGLKHQLLVKSFCLVRAKTIPQHPDDNNEGVQVVKWEVDADLLREAAGAAEVNEAKQGLDPETTDLPTKKDLLRRAKSMLSKSPDYSLSITSGKKEEGEGATPAGQSIYSVLDQSDLANLLLAEMLRSLIQVSFNNSGKRKNIGRKLCAYAIDESQHRVRDLAKLIKNEKIDKRLLESLESMKMIVEHLILVNRLIRTKSLQAKHVLRVILGISPQVTKNPSEILFPSDYRSALAATTLSPSDDIKAPALQPKKLRQEGAIGDQAIRVAMSKASFLGYSREHSTTKNTLKYASLQLTTPETLLLTVMGSQGFPVWTSAWEDIVDGDSVNPARQGPGHHCVISWDGMGQVFEAAAELWHTTAAAKLSRRRSVFNEKYGNLHEDCPAKKQATMKLLCLEKEEIAKRRALAIAADYSSNPRKLAQKCIMLVEALREKMGPVDWKIGETKNKRFQKSEHGLCPFVLHWFGNENLKWAESFKIVDSCGRPYCYTAIDFVQSGQTAKSDERIDVAAVMEMKGCRKLFTQIAQQSRLRSIFLRYPKAQLLDWVVTAVKNCKVLERKWDGQPNWWRNCGQPSDERNHDFVLLESLLEYGYSGIEESVKLLSPIIVDDDTFPQEEIMSRGVVQRRANQLTRELHTIEETTFAMTHLDSHRDFHIGTTTLQSGIQSFFATSTATKGESKHVEIIDNDSPTFMKRKVLESNSIELIEEVAVLSPAKKAKSQ